jgi:hypothetical protein
MKAVTISSAWYHGNYYGQFRELAQNVGNILQTIKFKLQIYFDNRNTAVIT